MIGATSLYDLWFGNKQYSLIKEGNQYLLFDNNEWEKCIEINEEVASRIHTLLSIQVIQNKGSIEQRKYYSNIYKWANCHGTAIYVLWHCRKDDFNTLDTDGDMFIYEERNSEKTSFEEKYLKPYTQNLLETLAMPIGVHFTEIFQRHSAILLWRDERNPEYYVSFQKIAYESPRVLASFREEILNLRNDICLIPNNYK